MQTYPTDLTPTELNLILPNLPILKPHPRRKWTYEILLNAIYYVLKGGIQWRMMPVNFPPWPTVYWYWRTWCQDGTWERLNTVLREKVRISEGRDPQPSAGVLDSQSAKTTEMGGERGYDGAKSVNGRKRFILVDTLGLLMKAHVCPANVKEVDGGRDLLEKIIDEFPRMSHLWVDKGFKFWEFGCWIKGALGWTVEISGGGLGKPGQVGFVVEPRRWVVERTLAWLTRYRRLSRDFERLSISVESALYACMTRLMVRRLGKVSC